jgi:protease-4
MKKRTAWILVAGMAAIAIGAAAVGAVALALRGSRGATVGLSGPQSYLYVDLDSELPEQSSAELGNFLERRPTSLRTVVESIDRAAGDPKVTSLVLHLARMPDAGWGRVQELRDAVARFRKSNKPAYAYLEFAGNKEYYLATSCNRIYALPTAILDITGLRSEVTFLRGTLDKLGVQAQFEGIGKYKNAPNQFTETGFTPAHREQMEALVDSLYEQYVSAIVKSRSKSAEDVQALIDAGPYDGWHARDAGLVDELLFRDQMDERLQHAGELTPGRYAKAARSSWSMDSRPKIALVYAVGEIATGESQNGPFGGSVAGSNTVADAIKKAREDDAIKAVLLRIDSPGGSGTASEIIWREVTLTRKVKPVVVSMGDVAASGGYYIAMASDAIVAEPGTITGSIGVFSGKFSLRGLYDKIGVSREIVARGEHSGIFSEYQPWNDAERARIHELMATFYADFVKKAADGRHKTVDDVDAVAQGRVWTGVEAQRHGLVDHLGGMDTALSVLREKAHIAAGTEVSLVVLPEKKGLLETILDRQQEDTQMDAMTRALPPDLGNVLRWSRTLADGAILARLPFDLRIR